MRSRAPHLAFVFLGLALYLRVALRGPYYAGWDLLGPAHGLYVLSSRPLFEALGLLARSVVEFKYWNQTDSLVFTLVPGLLTRLWPWEYWGHALNFLLVVATFVLIGRTADLPRSKTWLLALAWLASPALLSFSVCGYPYATGFLPHALALAVVTSPRLRSRSLLALIACLGVLALSWNVYEAGKTFFVTLVLAAVLDRSAPSRTRAAWMMTALLQAVCMAVDRGRNVALVVDHVSLTGLPHTAMSLLPGFFFGTRVDLPVLLPLGCVALLVPTRHRLLVVGGMILQLAAVVLLAEASGGDLFPRRYLTVSYYAVLALALPWSGPTSARRATVRGIILAGLVVGNAWQWIDTVRFFRRAPGSRIEPLPFTGAPDYSLFPREVDFARALRAEVQAGRRLLLLYNLSADNENSSNPAGVLERLYLGLGHDRFARSVMVFGSRNGRYDRLPIRPLDDVRHALHDVSREGPERVASVRVCYLRSEDSPRLISESAEVLAEIRRRFSILEEKDTGSDIACFGLARLPPQLPGEGPFPAGPVEEIRSDIAWVRDVVPDAPHLLPTPGHPFQQSWSGTISCEQPGPYALLLGVDGEARIFIDGRLAASRVSHGFALTSTRVTLRRGRNVVEILYGSPTGLGRLVWDIHPDA